MACLKASFTRCTRARRTSWNRISSGPATSRRFASHHFARCRWPDLCRATAAPLHGPAWLTKIEPLPPVAAPRTALRHSSTVHGALDGSRGIILDRHSRLPRLTRPARREDQRRDDGRVGLDDVLRRVGRRACPRLSSRSAWRPSTSRNSWWIADLAEVAPARHGLLSRSCSQHGHHADRKVARDSAADLEEPDATPSPKWRDTNSPARIMYSMPVRTVCTLRMSPFMTWAEKTLPRVESSEPGTKIGRSGSPAAQPANPSCRSGSAVSCRSGGPCT